MGTMVDRTGDFRIQIEDYGLKEMDSGAVAVNLKASLKEMWNPETKEWMPWEEYDQECYGDIWIIKKDGGGLNDKNIRSLVDNAGWNGDLDSISGKTWEPTICQATVTEEEYKGKTSFRLSFINPFDRTPGGSIKSLDADSVKSLKAKYGSSLRALVGSSKANAAKPNGKPPTPPKKAHAAAVAAQAPQGGGLAVDEDTLDPETKRSIPF